VQSSPRTTPPLLRLGGTASVLAGLCYGATGSLDRLGISGYIDVLLSLLSVAFPALFLGGLLGLRTQLPLATQTDFASSAGVVGFVLGCFGAVLGALGALGLGGMATTGSLWVLLLAEWWWVLFLAGLTLMGLAVFLKGGLRLLGAVVSISAALGWVSLLTDPAFSGVLVPLRSVHVAFAAAFCLSSMAWGAILAVPYRGH
jgi:hypothetical protein